MAWGPLVGLRQFKFAFNPAKEHRKRPRLLLPWIFLLLFLCVCTFFRFFFFNAEGLHPKLVISSLATSQMEALSGELSPPTSSVVSVEDTVIFPDQVLLFLKYPLSIPLLIRDTISCIYSSAPNSSHVDRHHYHHQLQLPPDSVDDDYFGRQIVRCPLRPRRFLVSLSFSSNGNLPAGPTYRWDSLAYEAIIDLDNTTIVFVKGFNLRPRRPSVPTKFKCVYGWDMDRPTKFMLQSDVVSIAQEIVRCRTPRSVLSMMLVEDGSRRPESGNGIWNKSVKASVRMVGRRKPLNSIARLERRLEPGPATSKEHEICICTMLRNQARFLREWVIYHTRIGVGRWFIYDNNSGDDIEDVIQSLADANYNITRHVWPWIKTQEAGFAHCALRARISCEWVGFIDVDEFFHSPSGLSLQDILRNYESSEGIAELRASCHSFGPSGLRRIPAQGVTVGYTCRMRMPERHKSIVRPEALNETLINIVHHFHLKNGYKHANLARHVLVINHYKYQVWEVFKEKFYMRVATYVSDWQRQQNVGSKDRTPGLGTRAVEPPDWSTRFCEVNDTSLRDRVLEIFTDRRTGKLPWLAAGVADGILKRQAKKTAYKAST